MLIGFKRFKFFSRKIQNYSVKTQLNRMVFILLGVIVLHTILIMHFENLSLIDSFWLTMTSATTVGYGDYAAKTTEGRIITIILLYFIGIAVLAQVASTYFEYRQEIKDRILKGKWYWKMKNHIVFLNCSAETEAEYFFKAISGLRESDVEISDSPIIIVSDQFHDGLPLKLQHLNVVLVNKEVTSNECMEAINIKYANTIILFSKNPTSTSSDSINFELVDRLRSQGVKGRIIVEAINDQNRERLKRVGADNILRPIRTYPELLMRTILAPGSEQVIETLFDSAGEECIRYDINCTLKWSDVITIFANNDIGVPVAYESKTGEIINNPSTQNIVETTAIFTFVRKGNIRKESELNLLLQKS